MNKTKVIIIDDSAFIREIFSAILGSDPEIEVLATACDPLDAREKIKALNPDVITLDIEMPKMDGISFLEKVMSLRPMPVIMVSTLTKKGASETIKCLELGALDYIAKPQNVASEAALMSIASELIAKVKMAKNARVQFKNNSSNQKRNILPFKPKLGSNKLIAIGSSTGGVEALREVLVQMPGNSPPIVVTQHMPEKFTKSFALRLDTLCEPTVVEAEDRQKILPGYIYIAPGGMHLEVSKTAGGLFCKILDTDKVSGHKPSVDVLFSSVAEAIGKNAIGVILTGMGYDGANGMLKMKQQGAYNIGQNEATCVVYGMPKAAKEKGGVDIELPVQKIASEILQASGQ